MSNRRVRLTFTVGNHLVEDLAWFPALLSCHREVTPSLGKIGF
jgi:hypothetical protein